MDISVRYLLDVHISDEQFGYCPWKHNMPLGCVENCGLPTGIALTLLLFAEVRWLSRGIPLWPGTPAYMSTAWGVLRWHIVHIQLLMCAQECGEIFSRILALVSWIL